MAEPISATVAFVAAAFSSATAAVASGLTYIGVSSATAATLASQLVTSATVTAISAATAALLRPSTPSSGMTLDFKPDPKAPITGMMGYAATGGNRVFQSTWGYNNVVLTLGAALSLGPITEKPNFYADNAPVTFDESKQNEAVGFYAADMWQTTVLGRPGVDPHPVTPTGLKYGTPPLNGWTVQQNPVGVAFSLWTMVLAKNPEDRDIFTNGEPNPRWVGRWMKVYDWRKDSTYPGGSGPQRENLWNTWDYSENPYIHARAFLRGHYKMNNDGSVDYSKRLAGVGAPVSAIDMGAFTEGANLADANNWVISGGWTSTDAKWDVLTSMLKAGGGIPIQSGAQVSVMLNAPRVSTTTIDRNDIVGEINIQPLTRRRERKNTIVPRYRSEAHAWEYVPAGPVTSTVYREEDNDELRSLEIQYNYVRLPKQAAQLAAYDLANLREGIKITATLKIDALGIAAGDCVTFDVPEVGLASQKFVVLRKTVDYQSATITVECRSETDGKHAWAMGQAANPPPTPSLSGVDPRYAPPPIEEDWVVIPLPPGENGVEVPIVAVEGETGTTDVSQVIVEYCVDTRVDPALPPEDAAWRRVYGGAPSLTGRYEVTIQPPGAQFWTSIQYVMNNGTISDRTIKGPNVASGLVSEDTTHIGGVPIEDIPSLDTTPPSTPTGLTTSSTSTIDSAGNPNVVVRANWTANTEPDLAGYEVEVTESGFTTVSVVGRNSYEREGLTGRVYSFRVRAFDKAGNRSGWTAVANRTGASDTTAPNAPTSLTNAVSLGSFFLEWTNPSASDLSKVEVWENTVNNSGTATRIATVNAMPSARGGFTRSGLSSGDTRWFWVRAVDTSGNASAFSGSTSGTLPTVPAGEIDTTPPGVPTGLSLTTNTVIDSGTGQPRTLVVATWTGPGDSDLAGYDVEVTEAGSNPVIRLVAGPRDEWATRPNVSFTVRVRAFDRVGNRSAFTAQQSITTSRDTTAPAAPTGLSSVASVGSIFLSGTAPSDSDLEKIEVWENTTNNSATATRIAVVNAMPGLRWSHPRTGLSANDTRWFWAKAVDTSGNVSVFSTGISQTVPYVANPDIAVGTLAGDRIVANSIEGSKLITNTSLPGTITVGSTGVTIQDVQQYANDPAARINTGPLTTILPGKIQISGGTTLADWRQGGDLTKIAGGSISANTVAANSLHIGQRGVELRGITFEANSPATNSVSWTAGTISYINNAGSPVEVAVGGGNAPWSTGNVRWIYWVQGAAGLNSSLDYAVASGANNVILAVYRGGTNLDTSYGKTIIEGDQIKTGGITANNLAAGSVVAGKLAADSVAANNIIGGTITGDKFNTGTSLPGTITVGSTGVSIGTVQEQAANPVGTINAGTTQITPGMIQISGATTLADWRQGGDLTKIAGGSLSANTVAANALHIGQRGVNFDRFGFTTSGNTVTWNVGRVSYVNDSGTAVTNDVSAGSYTYAGSGVTYLYWEKSGTTLLTTKTLSIADNANTVLVATYYGGTNFTANYGRTVISGDFIQTGAVTADKINVNNLSAINANLGTVTAGTLQNTALTYILDLTNGRETSFVGSGGVAYRGNDVGLSSEGIYLWVGPSSIARADARKSNAWLGLSMNTTGGPRFFGSDAPSGGGDLTVDTNIGQTKGGSGYNAIAGSSWQTLSSAILTGVSSGELIAASQEFGLPSTSGGTFVGEVRLLDGATVIAGPDPITVANGSATEPVNFNGFAAGSGSRTYTIQARQTGGGSLDGGSAAYSYSRFATATSAHAGLMTGTQSIQLQTLWDSGGGVSLATTAPATIGTANAVGTGTTAARADHVHSHGNQAGGALHAAATTSAAGFMSAADKTKLNGVATGATANSTESATAVNGTLVLRDASNGAVRGHVFASGTGGNGVGGFTISGRSLYANGSDLAFNVAVSGPAFTPTSDIRLKYDFENITDSDAVMRLMQIEVLEYTRVQDGRRARGFGAQGLREISGLYVTGDEPIFHEEIGEDGNPVLDENGEAVKTPVLDDNGVQERTYLAVDPMAIIADLVAAVRSHEVTIGMLESRLAALEAK